MFVIFFDILFRNGKHNNIWHSSFHCRPEVVFCFVSSFGFFDGVERVPRLGACS
jgi:hypothetical protein